MSDLLNFVLKTLKPYFGNIKIEVDRENKKVTIRQKEQVRILTYDEVIDEIERMFTNGQ